MVVGGGPRMRRPVIAAQRGHHATLYSEGERRLGGQALLARCCRPGGRAASSQSAARAGVGRGANPHGRTLDRRRVMAEAPTWSFRHGRNTLFGRHFRRRALQIVGGCLRCCRSGDDRQSVVVIEWRADWIGIGIADTWRHWEGRCGLPSAGLLPERPWPLYVRDHSAACLHKPASRCSRTCACMQRFGQRLPAGTSAATRQWSSTRSTPWCFAGSHAVDSCRISLRGSGVENSRHR